MKTETAFHNFESLDIRIGTILSATPLVNARNPAYVLELDFGKTLGILKSSAQITDLYQTNSLVGTQVVAVVNFPHKQIGSVISQCLVLGIHTAQGVVLLSTERAVQNGLAIS